MKDTQHILLLKHFNTGASITPLEALKVAKTLKLASRISELRRMHYNIKSKWEYNAKTGKRYMRYWLPVKGK